MTKREEIYQVLKKYYHLDEEQTDRGCYINGKWFSIDSIITILITFGII